MAYLALYHGRGKTFQNRLIDLAVRIVTRSKYSHCEIALPLSDKQFLCFSSSPRDGGVRCKIMKLPYEKWSLIPIASYSKLLDEDDKDNLELEVERFFGEEIAKTLRYDEAAEIVIRFWMQKRGQDYDFNGVFGFIFPFVKHSPYKWFCSEWCAEALFLENSEKYTPKKLASYIYQFFQAA